MKPYDIYHADHYWRDSNYGRFYILIQQVGEEWDCCAIASRDDRSEAFQINELDSDFAATGLRHTSYAFDNDPLSRIAPEKFANQRKGVLQGDLLKNFCKETGHPLPQP